MDFLELDIDIIIINYYSIVYCNNRKCSNTSSLDHCSVCISYANQYMVDSLILYFVGAWDNDDD